MISCYKNTILTCHQNPGSFFMWKQIDSFWSFSTCKYSFSKWFKLMFWSLGSSESIMISLCAICVSNTLSQCTLYYCTNAAVSSQKSWKILITSGSSSTLFKHLGSPLSLIMSNKKHCSSLPIWKKVTYNMITWTRDKG